MKRIRKILIESFFLLLFVLPLNVIAQNEDKKEAPDNTKPAETTLQEENTQDGIIENQQNVIDNTSYVDTKNFGANDLYMSERDAYIDQQINRRIANLNENADDNLEMKFEGIAEMHAKELQKKMNIDEDTYGDVKEEIVAYLKEYWEQRIELAQQSNDPESLRDEAGDLANLRVDFVDEIKDDLDDAESMWSSNSKDFWNSLDHSIFDLTIQEGQIAINDLNGNQNY